MQDIVDSTIVGGHLDSSGVLQLERHDGGEVAAGNIAVSFNLIYPVGSIYLSVNNTNPGTLFGGTWVAFGAGRMLIGVNPADTRFDTAQETGGTDTITANMLPAHTHPITGPSGNGGGGHSHPIGGSTGAEGAHFHGVGTLTAANEGQDHTHNLPGTISLSAGGTVGAGTENSALSVAQGPTSGRFVHPVSATGTGPTSGRSAAHTHGLTGRTGPIVAADGTTAADHSHTLPATTGLPDLVHSHTLPAATGNNTTTADKLLPPYIAVYMWRRTA
jgi:hypothetical protein